MLKVFMNKMRALRVPKMGQRVGHWKMRRVNASITRGSSGAIREDGVEYRLYFEIVFGYIFSGCSFICFIEIIG